MPADRMPLIGFDHLELWVGNARQAAAWYAQHLGFRIVGYSGPETGEHGRASYVLEQGRARFVLTSSLGAGSEIAAFAMAHGDGVRDVAFEVPDATSAFEEAVRRGATPHSEPRMTEDDAGKLTTSAIKAYGDTVHSFIERSSYSGVFAPGFVPYRQPQPPPAPAGIVEIDHVVANVEWGRMDRWVGFYEDVLGFSVLKHYDDDDITTEYSALMSKVVWDGTGVVKLPINEPAAGRKMSQIQEYLGAYGGPGVQHVALLTDDIVATVDAVHGAGLRLLATPSSYYRTIGDRVGDVGVGIDRLESRGILADRDEEGYLLQIFTSPVQDRPTLFYEFIERHGSLGFGDGNFQALFEAIEREQAERGNL